MIDIHCHILPGIDDGARDAEMALKMARIAEADGIRTIVCTPHVTPGVFDNDARTIGRALAHFRELLQERGISLQLLMGCDMHVSPLMPRRIREGVWPTVAGTGYFLFEPPHHVVPPNIEKLAAALLKEGYVPILTHPERLTWIESHYDIITRLDEMGVAMQITAGAITGRFGRRPRYWAERMLQEGRVDIIATDAHNVRHRPPLLAEGVEAAARIVGEEAARAMVELHPRLVLENRPLPRKMRKPMVGAGGRTHKRRVREKGWLAWLGRAN